MYNRVVLTAFICILIVSPLFLYQNCAQDMQANEIAAQSVVGDFDIHEHPAMEKPKFQTEVQPIYMSRMLTYNIYLKVFGPSVKNMLVERIAWAPAEMGSAFSDYNKVVATVENCNANRSPYFRCRNETLDTKAQPIAGSSATREGRRMIACKNSLANNNAVNFAFNQIQANATIAAPPTLSRANLEKAFRLFFVTQPLPEEAFFDQLQIVVSSPGRTAAQRAEGWKSAIFSLCLSPHWQVL